MSKAEDILERFKKSLNSSSTRDERLKVVLICLIISTTFWFFNALNKSDYVTRISYPISINFDESNYIATSDLPNRVSMEVSGGGWDLMTRYFGFKMKTIEVDIENPKSSSFLLTSNLRSEITPEIDPISINYFLEDTIHVKLEPRVSTEVVLSYKEDAVNTDEEYLRVSPIQIQPASTILTGPQSAIESIGDTLWISENLEGISEEFDNEIDLPQLPELVTSSVGSVNVNFMVVRLLDMSINLPVQLINFPDTTWVSNPSKVTIEFKVPETNADVTDSTQIEVFADYRLMAEDSTITLGYQKINDAIREILLSPKQVKATSKND